MANRSGVDRLGRAFHAMADPTRRQIVEQLVRAPCSVKALAEPLPISLPSVLEHLRVLEQAEIVVTRKDGRVRSCHVNTAVLREAEQYLAVQRTRVERQLDRLDDFLKGQ